jgi:hypothetical protein
MSSEDLKDSFDEPRGAVIGAVTEQISTLDGREGTATADVPVRDFAIIEPDWDKPRLIWAPEPHLLDCQREFLVLVSLATSEARAGKAGDKHERIVSDRTADLRAPVLAWPQIGRIPPHGNTRGLKRPMQLVDPM